MPRRANEAPPLPRSVSTGEAHLRYGGEDHRPHSGGLETLEEVARLLQKLPSRERSVVRLYYLEGRSYEEISTELNMPVNSIGPILSRARQKLRKDVKSPPPRVVPPRHTKSEGEA